MKNIKTFESFSKIYENSDKFFENTIPSEVTSVNLEEITSTLNDIFLELSDSDYEVYHDDLDRFIEVDVYKSSCNLLEMLPTFETAINFMSENGFDDFAISSMYIETGKRVGSERRLYTSGDDNSIEESFNLWVRWFKGDPELDRFKKEKDILSVKIQFKK